MHTALPARVPSASRRRPATAMPQRQSSRAASKSMYAPEPPVEKRPVSAGRLLEYQNQLKQQMLNPGAQTAQQGETMFQLTQLDIEALPVLLKRRAEGNDDAASEPDSVHGAAAFVLQDYTRAIEEWSRALEGDVSVPRACFVLRHRGAAYAHLGRLDHALKDVDKALSYQPTSFDALALRADIVDRMGVDAHIVLATYAHALREVPSSTRVLAKFALVAERVEGHAVASQIGWPLALRELAPGTAPAVPAAGAPTVEGVPGCMLSLKSYVAAEGSTPARPVYCVAVRPTRGMVELSLACFASETWGTADVLAISADDGGVIGAGAAAGSAAAVVGAAGSPARPASAAAGYARSSSTAATAASLQHAALARAASAHGRLSLVKYEKDAGVLILVSVLLAEGGRIEVLSNSSTRADALARALLLEQPPSFRRTDDFEVSCYGWLPNDGAASRRFCTALAHAQKRHDTIFHRAHQISVERAFGGGGRRGSQVDVGGEGEGDERSTLALSTERARELTAWLVEIGLEHHAAALIQRGTSLNAPLGLSSDELELMGVRTEAERVRLAELHAAAVQLKALKAQLSAGERRAEQLMLRLDTTETRAETAERDLERAHRALHELTVSLERERNESAGARSRLAHHEARVATDATRNRELEQRVHDFLADAGQLVDSTKDLRGTLRDTFYDNRRQLEEATAECISRFTGTSAGVAPEKAREGGGGALLGAQPALGLRRPFSTPAQQLVGRPTAGVAGVGARHGGRALDGACCQEPKPASQGGTAPGPARGAGGAPNRPRTASRPLANARPASPFSDASTMVAASAANARATKLGILPAQQGAASRPRSAALGAGRSTSSGARPSSALPSRATSQPR